MLSNKRKYLTLVVLIFINGLNYMDRFTVAGVLTMLQQNSTTCSTSKCRFCCCGLGINDSEGGFLTTSFIISYTLFSFAFGYFGDRHSRKNLIGLGILIWSGFTLGGSFATSYGVLVLMRSLVGIGEASYGTIAPTIIADLFPKEKRMRMLSFFYLATPIGSALGYMIGSVIAHSLDCWKWALRVTPGFGFICSLLCFFLIEDPVRGQSDVVAQAHDDQTKNVKGDPGLKPLCRDIWHILRCKSFLWSSLGFAAMSFVIGAVAQWGPAYIMWATGVVNGVSDDGKSLGYSQRTASIGFGALAVGAGIIGVLVGSEWAKRWSKTNPRADALVCAIGGLASAPFIFLFLVFADFYLPVMWVLGLIGETFMMLIWAPVAAILLYVVVPEKRSVAEAIQILFVHLLGDAFSPFIIGLMSDALRPEDHVPNPNQTTVIAMKHEYYALQYSLFMTAFVAVIGAACFFAASFYLEEDGAAVIKQLSVQAMSDRETSPLYDKNASDDEVS